MTQLYHYNSIYNFPFDIYYKEYSNIFASQRLVFQENNEPFLLENASNLKHEFLYDNFNFIKFY